ncbi:uroporphyrinogen-III synthase [Coemansia sp. RSA 2706]|nr:uroporphyrinogen-III synthase [Coemansia sp. RSA 2706]
MAGDERSAVILFRDQDRGDSYSKLLQESHAAVETIPVLDHRYLLAAADIADIIHRHSHDTNYSAIIFTSQNAVKALAGAAAEWQSQPDTSMEQADRAAEWRRFLALPIFVVGKATAAACSAHLLDHSAASDIRGDQCGQAAVLLPEIIRFCRQQRQRLANKPQLLFFCGDQRRDTLPGGIAGSHEADLRQIISYTTAGRQVRAVTDELADAMGRIVTRSGRISLVWMVVFSPSGARVIVPALRALERKGLVCPERIQSSGAAVYRLAAIGKTTASELVTLGIDGRQVTQASEPSEHGNNSNRFGAFSNTGGGSSGGGFTQTTAFGALGNTTPKKSKDQPLTGALLKQGIEDRPLWKLSVFGPTSNKPNMLSGTDVSPEEMHLDFMLAERAGNVPACQQKYAQLADEMDQRVREVVGNADSYALKWENQYGQTTPQPSGAGGTGAFGQAASAFGQKPFGQSAASGFGGSTSSAFGQPTTPKQSAFGSSAFGQSSGSGGFGKSGASGGFGQSSASGGFGQSGTGAFGKSTTGAFGQSSGTGSAFGQSSGTGSAFGQSSGASAFGQSSKPSAFGQPSPAQSAFGNTGTSAFGSTGTSAFGNAGTSAFGNRGASAFGSNSGTSAFGQILGGSQFAMSSNTSQQISGKTDPTRDLSAQEIECFKNPQFTMGQIPEIPPTADLC